ncbi:hypothetical protein FJY69_09710, partial [candidate division WOR-3 bacterium]|nr:hypothetical protein [candidate division WOR-3 bacterium]
HDVRDRHRATRSGSQTAPVQHRPDRDDGKRPCLGRGRRRPGPVPLGPGLQHDREERQRRARRPYQQRDRHQHRRSDQGPPHPHHRHRRPVRQLPALHQRVSAHAPVPVRPVRHLGRVSAGLRPGA